MPSSNQTTQLEAIQALQSLIQSNKITSAAVANPQQAEITPLTIQAASTAVAIQPDPAIPGAVTVAMRKLRAVRDRLLNETLANNPLQRAAATVLTPLAEKLGSARLRSARMGPEGIVETIVSETSPLDILENIGSGAAIGSVLIPDDAAVDPTNPIPAVKLAGIALGALGEGIPTDIAILRGLKWIQLSAKAKGATNIAKSADVALDLFGQGEDMSRFRQVIGGSALGGTSELALQTAGLKDPKEILAMSGLVALGGGVVGGAIASVGVAGRKVVAGVRGARSFAEELAERGSSKVDQIKPKAEQEIASGTTKPSEAGLQAGSEFEQRIDVNAADIATAAKVDASTNLAIPPKTTTTNAPFEALFDKSTPETFIESMRAGFGSLKERFKQTFVYETNLQKFSGVDGIDGINLADDVRFASHNINRSASLAEKDIELILAPIRALKRNVASEAFEIFERIIVARDLLETASKGHQLPLDISAKQLADDLLLLEHTAPKAVLEAAHAHKQLVGEWLNDLIRRGKLNQGDGYENYFPHQLIEDLAATDAVLTGANVEKLIRSYPTSSALRRGALKQGSRPYTRQRKGSARAIKTDYIEVMYRAARMFHVDNAVDDFIDEIAKAPFTLSRKSLTPDQLKQLNRSNDGRVIVDGQTYKEFAPKGNSYFRAAMVQEEALETLAIKIQDDIGIDITDLPEIRNVLAVGKKRKLLLPLELTERLEQFYAPDPLSKKTLLNLVSRANSWWKRNTIWWGLQRFFVFQVLGDSTNLLRSNPAAFVQIRNGRLDSPVLRSINEIFKKYGTPLLSKEQVVTALVGGVGGMTLDQFIQDDADPSMLIRAASILSAAGLGYIVGTRRVAKVSMGFSSIYDEADKLAVVNSGFTFSEEALARRIGGAGLQPIGRSNWLRAMDTIFTMLSGKASGDPFAFARIPAEVVERVQIERENVLRMASYMQMIERGVDNKVAARRAAKSLVDYGMFTEFENKILRGFALPFYAFYRHNIPNWIKAAAGKDVGGKVRIAQLAVAGIAAADITVQAWNETFFPDIEKGLPEFQRRQFHIIVGNPITGEPYSDVKGTAMIVGWEMPYEQALEFFGLARPGYIYSQLFGVAGELQGYDLTQRIKRQGEDVIKLRGAQRQVFDLLSPVIKLPGEFLSNKNFFNNMPIVPERFIGTAEGKKRMLAHIANTLFRQIRETKRLQKQVAGRRFDPLSSAFGLGLPIRRVRPARQWQGHIHEAIDDVQLEIKQLKAPYKKAIDDIFYARDDFGIPNSDEQEKVFEAINRLGLDRTQAEAANRYWQTRGSMGGLMRRWESLSVEEVVGVWNALSEEAQTYLVGLLNGGQAFDELVNEGVGIDAAATSSLLGG